MMVDAHCHIWRPARGDYGWLTPALGAIHRDVTVEDWWQQAAPCGVHGALLVQAAPTEAETAFLLEQADGDGRVLGVVGWADLLAADAPRRIERLAANPKLKGLRPMLQDIVDADWIVQPALRPALEAMVAQGLVFDALIKPQHLPRIRTLCERHPTLQVVIDHGAKPAIGTGHASAWQPWADEIARIASQTNAVCKLSGLLTEAGPAPRVDAARRWIDHLVASFGTARLLWGSDWPVLERAGAGYRDWWTECRTVIADEAVFGANARRIYRV